MKIGIVGLPNVGKSTLFNAITNAGAEMANYPFCTIDPNVGVVTVADIRLDFLAKMYDSKKYTPAIIEFVDIAGLVKGASKGEGLGNKFLANIREVDAIVHVVRCFEDSNIVHVDGAVDPIRDIETINLELIFADMEMIEKRIDKAKKGLKADKSLETEIELFERLKETFDKGQSARSMDMTDDEYHLINQSNFLTIKPVIYAANLGEDEYADVSVNKHYKTVEDYANKQGAAVLPICAKIEAEISELEADEKLEFLKELGIEKSGLDLLVQESYTLLGLISFLTAGPDEVRAWTIKKGTKAPQAAGKIHSDFERGFIRAEIVAYNDLVNNGTMSAAKEKGLVRSEGKDYEMKDGDVTLFRFNV